ncbi:phosphatase PAP2 family protein [Streptacidiphilus fuscans]|uniref:Phosphatase PAP2 family protein n=1 Tax=Streptacidiphilus fuscans TaxID=2789292 RepID=A0A931B3P4_9ACTN|nr:phosphatase PAP2 family protein [Streptacidiphilus fuscans]MBF9070544.1 phosphatase PAP2 family protein [Streptacidiphilus fuscans]
MSSTAATPGHRDVARNDAPGVRVRELLLVAVIYVAYIAYDSSRLLVRSGTGSAQRGATGLLDLGIPADFAYATLHYLATPAVLIWLWRRHHRAYRRARTWLGTTTVLALVGSACFRCLPVTPPRLPLAVSGLHVAWALWCGVMLVRFAQDRTVRTLGLLYPVIIALVVTGAGDHSLSDVLAGGTVVVVGGLLAGPVQRANARVLGRRRPTYLSPLSPR